LKAKIASPVDEMQLLSMQAAAWFYIRKSGDKNYLKYSRGRTQPPPRGAALDGRRTHAVHPHAISRANLRSPGRYTQNSLQGNLGMERALT
jgi:hypothetical protein